MRRMSGRKGGSVPSPPRGGGLGRGGREGMRPQGPGIRPIVPLSVGLIVGLILAAGLGVGIGLVAAACSGPPDNSGYRGVPPTPVSRTRTVPATPDSTSDLSLLATGRVPGVPNVEGNVGTTPTGLRFIDERVGAGQLPSPGQRVTVHYTGWLVDGKKFDSSRDRGDPFSFTLGRGEVIQGWDEGVSFIRVGGKRRLIIPPELGYGGGGAPGGAIPPNSVLVFDVELLSATESGGG